MASSGIGGQAVMEGIMMKNQDTYAIAVRKPDASIVVEKNEYESICKNKKLRKIPFFRGVVSFLDSMILGMKTLTFSASFFEEEEKGEKKVEKSEGKEKISMGLTIATSIVFALVIFMVIPFCVSLVFQKFIESQFLIILLEGFIRLLIFFLYIFLISQIEDIKRVFMYHGAEHKCINCIENGWELTVENVRKSSKEHKRCGTSFLFFVVIVSIVLTLFIQVDSTLLRLGLRLAIVPLVAGISYEIIRLAGNSENILVHFISKPGLWMQGLTTKEPDDEIIQVGIASVEAVFDWKEYISERKKNRNF